LLQKSALGFKEPGQALQVKLLNQCMFDFGRILVFDSKSLVKRLYLRRLGRDYTGGGLCHLRINFII